MITSGGPDRAQGRPVTVGKGVAKSACPATGPGPFLYSPGCDRPKPIAPGPSATSPPVTRSLPVPLPGRDGLVHGLVDAEDLRQPGDPEDPQYPLPRADQIQRAVVHPHPPQAPDQHPEAGGVEEPHLVQVDDELVAALADQVDEQLPQPRRGILIDLALHVDDLNAVLGLVTQLLVHTSSSAMPGVIAASIPAPRAGVVVRARAGPLPHEATFHYRAYAECSGCRQVRHHP